MRRPVIQLLFILMLTLQFTSCITTHDTNYMQSTKNFIPAYKDTVLYQEYRLRSGDKLFIQVYSLDEKTNALFNGTTNAGMQMMSTGGSGEGNDLYTYTIDTNGTIQLPTVGAVLVQGKTLRETKVALEEAIKPILKINSVDVRMMGRFFSIVGSGKSGRFAFPREKVNIFQALAMAGDFGFYTDRSKFRILRETENGTQIKVFDVRSVDIIHSEFYYLEPNDVIFLQPMKAQFFGVSTFWTAVSTLVTTYSFGYIIYKSFF
ncbi:MAG TPA: polysaccharide biosynthesis/export family protein [Paludibacter sp.]